MSKEYRQGLMFLLLATAVILAAGLGLRDPWPADEPRFALIARDMAESGGWLIPSVGGVLYPDKPPLHFWLVAALYATTGSLKFAFLLPALLGGLVIIGLVTDLGRRLWGETAGLWSGAILLSMLQFPLQMKSGQLDGPLCVWTTLSLYGFCRHALLGPDWRWYALGGLAAGLGIITKGVGFLPYLLFIALLPPLGRNWSPAPTMRRDWRWMFAPCATLAAVAFWLVPMLIATGSGDDPAMSAYRDNILFHQTVTRYADSWGHIKPPWYLLTHAAPWLWLPATLVLPWLVPVWWRDLKARRNTPLLVLGGWVVLVLLFFSMSSGKRSVYIFPAAPAFALIVGSYATELVVKKGVRRAALVFAFGLPVLLTAVGMYGLMNPHELSAQLPDVEAVFNGTLALVGMGLFGVVLVVLLLRRRPFAAAAVSLAVFWIGLGTLVAPAIDGVRSGRNLMQAAEAALVADDELGLVGWPEQFLLQAGRELTHFGYRRDREAELADAILWLEGRAGRRILVSHDLIRDCLVPGQGVEVGRAHRRNWWLSAREDLVPACRRAGPLTGDVFRYRPPGAR